MKKRHNSINNRKKGQFLPQFLGIVLSVGFIVIIVWVIATAYGSVAPNKTSNVMNTLKTAFSSQASLQFNLEKGDTLLVGYLNSGQCPASVIDTIPVQCDYNLCFCLQTTIADNNKPTQCSSFDTVNNFNFYGKPTQKLYNSLSYVHANTACVRINGEGQAPYTVFFEDKNVTILWNKSPVVQG